MKIYQRILQILRLLFHVRLRVGGHASGTENSKNIEDGILKHNRFRNDYALSCFGEQVGLFNWME